jgi:hypothetical protein
MALFSDAPRRLGVQPFAHVPEFEQVLMVGAVRFVGLRLALFEE